MAIQDVDGIAFTRGPGKYSRICSFSLTFDTGMGGCLSVSVNAGKSLAAALRKPIVGVHHMVSQLLVYKT